MEQFLIDMEEKLDGSNMKPFFVFRPPGPPALSPPAEASSNAFLEASKSSMFKTACQRNSLREVVELINTIV